MSRRRWAVVLGAATVVGASAWALWPSEQPFYDYVAKLRAEGVPTTLDELTGPMPPDADNAAPEIEAAVEAFQKEFGPPGDWPRGAWNWELFPQREEDELAPEQRQALCDFADGVRPFAGRVAAALTRPRCRFALHFDRLFGLASRADFAQESACLLADVAHHAHDADARFDACRTLALLASRLEPRGFKETRIAMDAADRCVGALRAGIEDGTFSPSLARDTFDPLLRGPWLPRISASYRRATAESAFYYGELLAGRYGCATPVLGRAKHELDDALRRLRGDDVERRFEPGHPERTVEFCEFARAAAELSTGSYVQFSSDFRALVESRDLGTEYPGVGTFASWLASVDAATRLARIALAAAEHRATHGDYPVSLADLESMFPDGVPLDPYTDAAFVYARTVSGVRIASAGRLADDPAVDEAELRERCLVWELKR